MFSKLAEFRRSEDGTIATVYMLGAALLFIAAITTGFALGKYAQGVQMLSRCTNMVAKSTMVYMQRQAPPDKGVLTKAAQDEGIAIFNTGICNSAFANNPMMKDTANITFQMAGPNALLVTIDQRIKGYVMSNFMPVKISQQAVAYTYQSGAGQAPSPIYNGSLVPKVSAPVVGLGSPTGASPSPSPTGAAGVSSASPAPTNAAGGGSPSSSPSGSPTPSPSPVATPTYDYPYPDAAEGLICHATSNANKFPYQQIGPAPAGIISGHMGHTNDVYPIVTKNWGDIVPPMPAIGVAGLNWSALGKAIWHNNCDIP